MRSIIAAAAVLLGVCAFAAPAHAEEWRWCAAGDLLDDGHTHGPHLIAGPFQVDGAPDYEAQYKAYVLSRLEPIQGEFIFNCSPPFADSDAAVNHYLDWLTMMDGFITKENTGWSPQLSARQATPSAPEPVAKTEAATKPAAPVARTDNAQASNTPNTDKEAAQQAEERRQHWEREQRAAQQGGKPLRFVLWVPMQPRVGDTSNPSCYSNVITRPGPSGWGAENPAHGVPEQAIAIIDGVSDAFVAKCRAASGREVAGGVRHERNQSADDEARVDRTHAVGANDVTVQMD